MKIKLIACEVFCRELSISSAYSKHVIDTKFLSFGLHDTPEKLRQTIQEEIDAAENQGYEFIILGYGLCSRGIADVSARSIPIVIPRAHDCITLFLGSRSRYNKCFSDNPGTYYFSPGWIERKDGEISQSGFEDAKSNLYKEKLAEYIEKYGEENAEFLLEQEAQWMMNYNRAVFIDMGVGDIGGYRSFVKTLTDERGWEFVELEGDMTLINRIMCADWDNEDILIIKPGETITESFDEFIIKAK